MLSPCSSSRLEQGFSMIEMVVVLAILAIVASSALPGYGQMFASFNRQNAVNQIEFDIRRARSEALADGTRGVIAFAGGGSEYSFGIDQLPYSNPAVANTQEFRRVLPKNVTASSSVPLVFDSRGYLINASSGAITSATLSINYEGTQFCSGSVFSTGTISLACN